MGKMRYRDRITLALLVAASVCFFLSWHYKYLPARPAALDATFEHAGSILHSAVSPYLPYTLTGVDANDRDQNGSTSATDPHKPTYQGNWVTTWDDLKPGSPEHLQNAPKYISSIMDLANNELPRLACPRLPDPHPRYEYLKPKPSSRSQLSSKKKYFFTLDLYQCVEILPSLLGAVVEAIRFLGPEYSVLSIVEGRSNDGTYEILKTLKEEMDDLGVEYHLGTNDMDPKMEGGDRIAMLADLRNQALEPLYAHAGKYSRDAIVLFINDISLCVDDILELVHQKALQGADMTCAMDWIYGGSLFYDVWVSRGISGDSFFEIPQSRTWDFATNLFWNDAKTKARFDAVQPFQVYACWNGAAIFTAEPLLKERLKFRRSDEGECFMGEPTLFCKDMWRLGYNKIATIPSVNVAYGVEETVKTKGVRGYVHDHVMKGSDLPERIDWQEDPPPMVKCTPDWDMPSWVPPI